MMYNNYFSALDNILDSILDNTKKPLVSSKKEFSLKSSIDGQSMSSKNPSEILSSNPMNNGRKVRPTFSPEKLKAIALKVFPEVEINTEEEGLYTATLYLPHEMAQRIESLDEDEEDGDFDFNELYESPEIYACLEKIEKYLNRCGIEEIEIINGDPGAGATLEPYIFMNIFMD